MICAEFQPQLAHPSRYGCLWKILPHLKRCHQEAITLNLYLQVHIIKNNLYMCMLRYAIYIYTYIYIYGLEYFTKLIIQPFGGSPNLNHHSSDRKRCLSFMGPLYRLHVTGTHGHLGRLEFQVPRWSFEDPNGLGSKLNVVQTKNIQTPDPINAIFAIWVLKRNMQSVQNKISLLGSPHQSCHVWVWTILKRLFNPRHIYISYDCIYTIHVGQTFANSTFDFTPGTLSILKPLSC
jgi:hypothetical protein